MSKNETDIEADTVVAEDRGEAGTLMEPLIVQSQAKPREELADLALKLTAKSTALRSSLPEGLVVALSRLVRSMNATTAISLKAMTRTL